MAKHYLLIVEGEKTEQTLFEALLEKYGFHVTCGGDKTCYDELVLSNIEYQNEKNTVLIVKGPRNRISDLVRFYQTSGADFDKMFGENKKMFSAIFLIYDVDHAPNDDLESIFRYHNDETSDGLMLVSSPCIEVLSEPGRTKEIHCEHLRDYKAERNIYFSEHYGCNTTEYMTRNFERLSLMFMKQNYEEFNEANVMEHPGLIIGKINQENERGPGTVSYRYFTTVVYVALANICGLTREIDNYEIVKKFFESNAAE